MDRSATFLLVGSESPDESYSKLSDKDKARRKELDRSVGLISPRKGGFFSNLAASTYLGAAGTVEGMGATLNEAFGYSGLEDAMKEWRAHNRHLEPWRGYQGASDFSLSGLGTTIGQGLGQSARSIGVTTLGSILTGNPIAGGAIGAADMMTYLWGPKVREYREMMPNQSEGNIKLLAFVEALGEAAIENYIGPEQMAAKWGAGLAKKATTQVARQAAAETAKKFGLKAFANAAKVLGKEAAKGALTEGSEEVLQDWWDRLIKYSGTGENQMPTWEEMRDTFLGGALPGAFMGGIGATGDVTAQLRDRPVASPSAPANGPANPNSPDGPQKPLGPGGFSVTDWGTIDHNAHNTFIQRLGEMLGVNVHLATPEQMEAEKKVAAQRKGGSMEGVSIEGWHKGNDIFLNPEGTLDDRTIAFGHEVKHWLDENKPELSQDFDKAIDSMIADSKTAQTRIAELEKMYGGAGNARTEFICDLCARLAQDPKFMESTVRQLNQRQEGLGTRFMDAIREFLEQVVNFFRDTPEYETYKGMLEQFDQAAMQYAHLVAEAAGQRQNQAQNAAKRHGGGKAATPAAQTAQTAPAEPFTQAEARRQEESNLEHKYGDTQVVRMDDVKLDPKYFQFRKGMDEKTGIVPGQELKGKWRPANGGTFLLWEDRDGQKWLVNGHHRWGLARQNKVQNVNAVVMREADGVSREQARLEGIQVNLREGTSTVEDAADFFRNSGMTEEEARQSGILSDTPSDRLSKSTQGYWIGRHAGDELYNAYRAGDVSAPQAAAIAQVAQKDASVERLGVKAAKNIRNASDLKKALQVQRALFERQQAQTPDAPQQLGLFDNLPDEDAIIKMMERQAAIAQQHARALRMEIGVLDKPGKHPEIARKYGIDIKDPKAIKAKQGELRTQLWGWENWEKFPDVLDAINREIAEQDKPKPAKAKAPKSEAKPAPANAAIEFPDTFDGYRQRIQSWLSPDNLEQARGKSREEIFEIFGNDLRPIAKIPKEYLPALDKSLSDPRVYSGMGYLLDHAINHHPEVAIEQYLNMQSFIDQADEVRLDTANAKRAPSLLFIKKVDGKGVVVVSFDQNANHKVVLHKTFFDSFKANRFNKFPLVKLPLVDGSPTISQTDESASGRHQIPALNGEEVSRPNILISPVSEGSEHSSTSPSGSVSNVTPESNSAKSDKPAGTPKPESKPAQKPAGQHPARAPKTAADPNARNPFAGETTTAEEALEVLSGPGLDGMYVAERAAGEGIVVRKIRAAAVDVRIPTRLMRGEHPVFNIENMRGWNQRRQVNGNRYYLFFLPGEANLLRDALKLIEDNFGLAETGKRQEAQAQPVATNETQEPEITVTKHVIRPVRAADGEIAYQAEEIESRKEPLPQKEENARPAPTAAPQASVDADEAELDSLLNDFNGGRESFSFKKQDVEEVNRQFNEALSRYERGKTPGNTIYEVGRPGRILLACGFPDNPIRLQASVLTRHMNAKHPFAAEDLQNLPRAIQTPLAVFHYSEGIRDVIVDLQHNGEYFLVGVQFNKHTGEGLINRIRAVFPKHTAGWLNAIENGSPLYLDKAKIKAILAQAPAANLTAEQGKYDHVLNIIDQFQNPAIDDGTSYSFVPEGNKSADIDVEKLSPAKPQGTVNDVAETAPVEAAPETAPAARGTAPAMGEGEGRRIDPPNPHSDNTGGTHYMLRKKEPPKQTLKGYKLMRIDGAGKLYALFIDRANQMELGKFYDAESPRVEDLRKLKDGVYLMDRDGKATPYQGKGLPSVKEVDTATRQGARYMRIDRYADGSQRIHNVGVNGSGTVATFAYRPGWHATNAPSATHIGGGQRRADEVWVEIEYAADNDYRQEALSRAGRLKDGRLNVKEAQLDHIPEDGFYYYRTNTNADEKQDWILTGSIKPVRILSDAEVERLNREGGFRPDAPRKAPRIYEERVSFSLRQRDESLRHVSREMIAKQLPAFIQQKVSEGDYRIKNAEDAQRIADGALQFFDEFSHKTIPLSNGHVVYFMPDSRAFERLGNDHLAAWMEYCIHAVTSSGKKIEGKPYAERLYNPTKAANMDRIEAVIKEENAFANLRENPHNDTITFVGAAHDNKRMEVKTKPDKFGDINADYTEVTVLTTNKEMKTPPPRPLAEVVSTVAQHQAAGFSPETDTTITPDSDSATPPPRGAPEVGNADGDPGGAAGRAQARPGDGTSFSFRRRQQVNQNGTDEYDVFIDGTPYRVKGNRILNAQAASFIAKLGGIKGTIQQLLAGNIRIGNDVAQKAYQFILTSPEFKALSNDEQYRIAKPYIESGTELARGLAARRRLLKDNDQLSIRAAINAFLAHAKKSSPDVDLVAKLKEKGIDIENLGDLANDPARLDQTLRDITAALAPVSDKLYEFWVNSILSGINTHAANTIGNVGNMLYELGVKRFVEAAVNLFARNPQGATFGEMKHLWRAINWGQAWKAAMHSFNYEVIGEGGKFELERLRGPAIGGKLGRAIRIPGRFLRAADTLIKTLIRPIEATAMAYREGNAQGLTGAKLNDYIAEELRREDSNANEYGRKRAMELTFNEEAGAAVKWLTEMRDRIPGLRYLFPFVRTPFNLLRQGIRKSPLGVVNLASELIDVARGRRGMDNEVIGHVAEQIIAWSASMAILFSHGDDDEPWLTGNPGAMGGAERKFRNRVLPAYSIRIGDTWYSYRRIEPFATALASIADGIEAYRKAEDGPSITAAAKSMMKGTLRVMVEKSYLDTFRQMMEVMENPERKLESWGTDFVASWVPNIYRQTVNSIDDNIPDHRIHDKSVGWAESFFRTAVSKAGFASRTPALDYFGREIPKDATEGAGAALWRFLLPIQRKSAGIEDDVDTLVWNYNQANPAEPYWPSLPMPYVKQDGKRYSFTGNYQDFLRDAGELAHTMMEAAVRQGRLHVDEPSKADIELIKRIFSQARRQVRLDYIRQGLADED